ncbi:extracellular solute-binding protein [Clostridium sp. NSJ-6]|uniref:Extracellular solute-binding protein n=1 Tax=Clostridium hominis TaxID=2763036 RepID=A0ABR7D9U0_9CLOT|nr:extracellular solute-binding protein [Clostridium hominis]MBC5628156.1 extracellular solute-binding protein [Clostridium hominis]MDU2673087.1 extracellular solute-binding protein [Clostridium sp.]
MRFKKLLSILLASTLTLGLVACGNKDNGKSTGETTTGETTTESNEKITVWAWDESFNIVAANQAKEIYLKENPDVDIEVVTMSQDDIVAKLNTSLSSGSYEGLPNVVLIEDYKIQGYLQAYQDEFADLSSVAKASDFAEYKTGVNVIDGKLYGIPFDSGVAATFYRTDLIEQAGYTKEDMKDLTWEKYIEIGKAVKEKTGVAMCTLDPSDIGQIRMMLQSAGAWYTGENGEVTIAGNQALKDAIKVYKDLTEAGITKQVAEWDQFVGAFNNGEVASVVTGCWIAPSIKKAEDQSGKWAVAEFPKMSANSKSVNASSIGGAGWYVLKNVGNAETAVDFVGKTFGSNADLTNQLAESINLVSTLNAAADVPNYNKGDEYFGGQEVFKDLAEWTSEVPSVNYGLHTYAIEDIMTEALQAILQGADIDETLNTFQGQIEAAVAQ